MKMPPAIIACPVRLVLLLAFVLSLFVVPGAASTAVAGCCSSEAVEDCHHNMAKDNATATGASSNKHAGGCESDECGGCASEIACGCGCTPETDAPPATQGSTSHKTLDHILAVIVQHTNYSLQSKTGAFATAREGSAGRLYKIYLQNCVFRT